MLLEALADLQEEERLTFPVVDDGEWQTSQQFLS